MAKKRKHKKTKDSARGYINRLKLLTTGLIFLAIFLYGSCDSIKSFFNGGFIYNQKTEQVGMPQITDSTYFVENKIGRYSYLYSSKDKQSHWVAYMLTRTDLQNRINKRADNFRPDKTVLKNNWSSSTKNDYYKSSYDRGHLLPSADRNKTMAENSETFLLSNIAPQTPKLNRETWVLLEKQIRDWAIRYDTLYVVTAGVLNDKKMGYIGKNRITVPKRFYKVILSVKDNKYNAIGFVMPNSGNIKNCFMTYRMSVDDVEKITNINFFGNLPDDVQRAIESDFDISFWEQTKFGSVEKKRYQK